MEASNIDQKAGNKRPAHASENCRIALIQPNVTIQQDLRIRRIGHAIEKLLLGREFAVFALALFLTSFTKLCSLVLYT
jgi:hypothetical protein